MRARRVQPAHEVPIEVVQVGAARAESDVAVRSDEVLRCLLHAEAAEGRAVGVVQDAGCRLARQSVHCHEGGVALAQSTELTGVPAIRAPAEQELEARAGEGLLQPAQLPVAGEPSALSQR
jgi:hypothetical protein